LSLLAIREVDGLMGSAKVRQDVDAPDVVARELDWTRDLSGVQDRSRSTSQCGSPDPHIPAPRPIGDLSIFKLADGKVEQLRLVCWMAAVGSKGSEGME